jgi:predicted  nucleic acid-binding Zn-ribbon protein
MKKIPLALIGASLLSLASSLSGCKARPASAIQLDVMSLQDFLLSPGQGQTLVNNKLFLYPENMTADTFAAIKTAARNYDRLESEAFPFTRERAQLTVRLDAAKGDRRTLTRRVRDLQTEINGKQAQIDTELAKPEGERDAALIDSLNQAKALLETEIAMKREMLNAATAEVSRLEAAVAAVVAKLDEKNPQVATALDTLKASVQWFNTPPSSIDLTALTREELDATNSARSASGKRTLETEEQYKISIADWLEDESTTELRRFSSDEGTIQNLRYKVRAGRITFDVLIYAPEDTEKTQLLRQYSVDVRRTRYDATANPMDGRLYYTGDLILKDAAGTELRRGVAKLVTGDNN